MRQRFRSGGLASWSVRRPIAVVMLALTVVVLGLFSLDRLAIDLLPHIIYPEVRVRILDPGVPSRIMEDQITRQLEEQLAITEDAISVQSTTSEGRSEVDLRPNASCLKPSIRLSFTSVIPRRSLCLNWRSVPICGHRQNYAIGSIINFPSGF
jgi:hypothetical protein